MKDLKQVYQANTEEQAMSQLTAFGKKWERQYPTAMQELGSDYQSAQNHGQQRRMICNKKRKKSQHEINLMIIPA